MNPQAEGVRYPDVSFWVDPERVAAFREIFGMTRGVPPTFLTAAEFSVLPSVVDDPRLGLDFTRVVHGSQTYEVRRPIVEGETLTVRAHIDSVRMKGGTGFLTVVMDMLGADDEVAARATSVMLERAST